MKTKNQAESEDERLRRLLEEATISIDEPIEDDDSFYYFKSITTFNHPVSFSQAISRVSSHNCESRNALLSRNPRLVSDNVLEDDEDIYLLHQQQRGEIGVYWISKDRLDETDWVDHLMTKGWCDNGMLIAFKKIQNKYMKNKRKR